MDSSPDEMCYPSKTPSKDRKGKRPMRGRPKGPTAYRVSVKENEDPNTDTSSDNDSMHVANKLRCNLPSSSRYREPTSSEQLLPSTSKGFYESPSKLERPSKRKHALEDDFIEVEGESVSPTNQSKHENRFVLGPTMHSTPKSFSVKNDFRMKLNERHDSLPALKDDLNSPTGFEQKFPITRVSYRCSKPSKPFFSRGGQQNRVTISKKYLDNRLQSAINLHECADDFPTQPFDEKEISCNCSGHRHYCGLLNPFSGSSSNSIQKKEPPQNVLDSSNSSLDESLESEAEEDNRDEYRERPDFSGEETNLCMDSVSELQNKPSKLGIKSAVEESVAGIFTKLSITEKSPDDHSKPNMVAGSSVNAHEPTATSSTSSSNYSSSLGLPLENECNKSSYTIRYENLSLGPGYLLSVERLVSCQSEYDEAQSNHNINDSNELDEESIPDWDNVSPIVSSIDTSEETGSATISPLTDLSEDEVGRSSKETLEERDSNVQNAELKDMKHNVSEGKSDVTDINRLKLKLNQNELERDELEEYEPIRQAALGSKKRRNLSEGKNDDTGTIHPDAKRPKQNEQAQVKIESQSKKAPKRRMNVECSEMSSICAETGETQNSKIPKYQSSEE